MYLQKAHLQRIFMVEIQGYDSSVLGNSFICPPSHNIGSGSTSIGYLQPAGSDMGGGAEV